MIDSNKQLSIPSKPLEGEVHDIKDMERTFEFNTANCICVDVSKTIDVMYSMVYGGWV